VGNVAGSTSVPPPAARDSSSVVHAGAPVGVSAGVASAGAAAGVAAGVGSAGGSEGSGAHAATRARRTTAPAPASAVTTLRGPRAAVPNVVVGGGAGCVDGPGGGVVRAA